MDKAMIDVKVGETVKVVQYHGRRVDGENCKEAIVSKVARIWITVKVGDRGYELRFRRDDQTDGSGYGMAARFYTLDQWAKARKSAEASTFLREQGISVDFHSPWRGRETDLAAMLKLYIRSEKAVAEEEAEHGATG